MLQRSALKMKTCAEEKNIIPQPSDEVTASLAVQRSSQAPSLASSTPTPLATSGLGHVSVMFSCPMEASLQTKRLQVHLV